MTIQEALNAAVALHEAGRWAEAAQLYEQVSIAQPRNAAALHWLGIVRFQQGDVVTAIRLVRQAIGIEPNVAFFHSNLSAFLRATGDHAGAANAGRQSVALAPSATGFFNLGLALADDGRSDEAVAAFDAAIALEPRHAGAHNSRGAALLQRGDVAGAIHACRRAIELDADFADAHHNLATALRLAGQLEPAVEHFRAALALDPQSAETHNNLGEALRDQGMVDEAIAGFREALRLKPEFVEAHSNLLYAMQFSPRFEAAEVFAAHREWAARHADPLTPTAPKPRRRGNASENRMLRVGFVSPDFRHHPVGRFLLPILMGWDRERFHVSCYASGPSGADAMTARLRDAADAWRDVSTMRDAELAEQIRTEEVDILIDLAGHTAHHRLLCFARRPATVQATYLGYPDTTGMSVIDWRLTDAAADPPGLTEPFHAERLQRISGCAWCYMPPDTAPAPDASPRDVVHFGSFNNLAKISPETAELWATLLRETANSRLVIKATGLRSDAARRRLLDLFVGQGISPDRIDVLPPTDSEAEHLAAYAKVDVALDTLSYAGTTTTCEALWMGVPVVTLVGQRHVSRVGVSLLAAAGMSEWIAGDRERYVATAKSLAAGGPRSRGAREALREHVRRSSLTDVADHARRFGDALLEMWRSQQGPVER